MSHVMGAGGAAWESGSWRGRAADRLGHHASAILLVSIAGVVAIGLRPLPGILMLTVPLALVAVVLLSWALMRQHDRRLCEACVSSMPLNATEQASKYKRRFWLTHTGSEPRYLIPYLAVLVGSNFATSTVGRIAWAFIQLSMIYLIMSNTTHRKFQPWCPWCSGGGGGQEIDTPTPVIPHDDNQLV